jgi:hypothetical protein
MDSKDNDHQRNSGRVFFGLVIILIGLAMLGDRTGFYRLHLSGHYWPLILIVLGGMKMLDPGQTSGHQRSRRGGLWLIYVGCWGLVNEFHLFGFDYGTSWPLLIIGAGIGIVWRAFENPDAGRDQLRES